MYRFLFIIYPSLWSLLFSHPHPLCVCLSVCLSVTFIKVHMSLQMQWQVVDILNVSMEELAEVTTNTLNFNLLIYLFAKLLIFQLLRLLLFIFLYHTLLFVFLSFILFLPLLALYHSSPLEFKTFLSSHSCCFILCLSAVTHHVERYCLRHFRTFYLSICW